MKPFSTMLMLVLLGSSLPLFAQDRTAVRGRVLDEDTGEAIEYASIAVYRLPDSTLVTGTVTGPAGTFEVENLPKADVFVVAQFIGYKSHQTPRFHAGGRVDLGDLYIGFDVAELSEVEVSARAATAAHRIDKQVYAADQFQSAQGGTAVDVLRNLPGVSVDAQGQVSVRGATGFIVMVDGKPVQADPAVILSQLPANAIADIELITAPSAKYDPDGKAGIINIKTRQGVLDGLFLVANAQAGLPSVEPYANAEQAHRYSGDMTLNYRRGRWDVSAGLDYRRDDLAGRRVGYVNTYLNGVLTEFPSYGERSFDRENYSGRASVTFAPSTRQSVGASFYAGKRTQYRTADILYDYQQRTVVDAAAFAGPEAYWDRYRRTGTVLQEGAHVDSLTYFNENLRVRRGDFLIGAVDYAVQLTDASSLKISALYEHTLLGGPTDNLHLGYPGLRDTLQVQLNDNDNPLDGVRLQLDYAHAGDRATWEGGYQYRYLNHPGDFVYLDRNLATGDWVPNPLFTNGIRLKRQIHSVYGQVSGAWADLSYTAGLRLEYADRSVATVVPDTTYLLRQLSPFPSVNLQYRLREGLTAKAGYSRRIERTTTFMMTPFPEREHSETLEQGDARLRPEFIDLAEAGLVQAWGDHTLFVTGYYRNVENVINRVNTVFDATALNRIYTNAGRARAFGVEGGVTVYPAAWWRMTVGGNVYNYQIRGRLFEDWIDTASTIYSVNLNTSFELLPTLTAQANLNYLSERITAQGVDSRFYNPSLSLQKTFMDDRIAVTFQWLNMDLGLLDANEQRITTVRQNFYTTTNYIYEVDVLMVSVRYRLNQPSKKVKLIESEFGADEF